MSLLTSVRNKIETKIFTRLGSTVTRYPYNAQSVDKWGDSTISYSTTESITSIPYEYINKNTDFQPFGDVQAGDVLMAFKYDQTLNEKDKIVYDTKTYYVRQIENYTISDGVIVKVARLVEALN